MLNTVKSPFEGEPHTVDGRDMLGRRAFAISTKVLSPEIAQVVDAVALLIAPLLWYIAFQNSLERSFTLSEYLVAIILPPLLIVPFRKLLRYGAQRKVEIEMTVESMVVNYGGQQASFDRRLPHSFSLLPHDKAADEQDEIEAQRRGGSGGVPHRYFTRAFIVTYDYVGQRHDIVALMGQKEAAALHARLVLCDKLLDAEKRRRPEPLLGAGPDWTYETGVIEQ